MPVNALWDLGSARANYFGDSEFVEDCVVRQRLRNSSQMCSLSRIPAKYVVNFEVLFLRM